eukprot:s373_g41.t1
MCLAQNYTTKVMAHPKVTSYVCNFGTGMCAPGKVTKTYPVDEPDDLPDSKKAVICFPCGDLQHWSCHKSYMQHHLQSDRCVACRNVVISPSFVEKLNALGLALDKLMVKPPVPFEVASYQHVEELRKVIDDLKKAKLEETLEEQAATLLSLPERMNEILVNLCHKLQTLKLPPLPPTLPAATSLFVPTPRNLKVHVLCNLICLSGEGMGQFYAKKSCPWLDAVPFGVICHKKHVSSFSLMQDSEIVFPQPPSIALSLKAPAAVALHEGNDVPFSVKMMISKGGSHVRGYTPPMGTVPMYDFCELQTLLLREVDDKALKDLEFRSPEGPLAKKLLGCFTHLIRSQSKIGKRRMGEFRYDATTRTYILHMLVSTGDDGTTFMSLRAKNVYNKMYTIVPVIEGDKAYPWDKKSYKEICKAIMRTNS